MIAAAVFSLISAALGVENKHTRSNERSARTVRIGPARISPVAAEGA